MENAKSIFSECSADGPYSHESCPGYLYSPVGGAYSFCGCGCHRKINITNMKKEGEGYGSEK